MTTTNAVRLAAVVIGALFFQVTICDQVIVLGAHPDAMIIFPVAAGLLAGPQRGATVGFVFGLVADLVLPTPFGLSPLTFVLVGYGVGLLRAIPAGRDTEGAQVGACVIACALGTLGYSMIGALVGQPGMLGSAGTYAILVVALGAIALSWPVLVILRWTFAGTTGGHSYLAVPSGGTASG